MTDYQVGDKVIHATYGLGEIVKMDEKYIHDRQMLCYVVQIGNMTIWVMADEEGKSGLRPPTQEGDFEKTVNILRGPGQDLPVDRFERRTYLVERMKAGDLASICSVIRDIGFLRKVKKINDYDRATLERAKDLLLTEWMHVRSVSLAQASNELMKLIEPV